MGQRKELCYLNLLLPLLLATTIQAQELKGTVRDTATQQPLPLVNMMWQGTTTGNVTALDGTFTLPRSTKSNTLIVSCVGYRTDTLQVPLDVHSLDIFLRPASTTLKTALVKGRRKASYSKLDALEQTDVITTEGLHGLACCNLGESFQNSGTVDMGYSDAVSGSKQIQLLGLTGVYAQMLLENTPFLQGLSVPFGLGYVPGQWMESISVSKGVAQIKNGYEAVTGTINIEYEKPDKGDLFSLNLYGNSDLKAELTAKANLQLTDRLSTGLYVFGTYNDYRIDHLGHDGMMDVPLQRQLNVVNRWLYQGKHRGFHSHTLINYTHEERLGGDMDFTEALRGNDSIYGFGGTSDRLHFFTKNGFMLNDHASFGSQVTASYFQQEAYYGLSTYNGEENDLYVNLLINDEFHKGHLLDYGMSLQASTIDEQLYALPYLDARAFRSDSLAYFHRTEVVPGAFIQYTRKTDRFMATAGIRYDYNSGYSRHLITPRLHFRWNVSDRTTLRGSVGKGYRSASIIAENIGLLASSRTINFATPTLAMEEAINAGLNLSRRFTLSENIPMTVTLDYYHTEFQNQVVVDLDRDPNEAWIVNLNSIDGARSYSNVAQLDINIEFGEFFELSLAGKLNDVWCTYDGTLQRKPYTARWKGLAVVTYHSRYDKWRVDLTTQLNGPQRLPNNVSGQTSADPYLYMLGQVTRKFKRWECYAGVENITNYCQEVPVIGYDQPFTTAFDASVVYAPLMGRLYYLGLRLNIQ